MKNLHHSSRQRDFDLREQESQRRYPFLIAIDLALHFGLSIAALVLTIIALMMAFDTVLPTLARLILK